MAMPGFLFLARPIAGGDNDFAPHGAEHGRKQEFINTRQHTYQDSFLLGQLWLMRACSRPGLRSRMAGSFSIWPHRFPSTPRHSCFNWKKPTKPLPVFETGVCRARQFSACAKSKRQSVAKLDALKHLSGSEPVVVVGVVQVVAVHRIEAWEQDVPVAGGVHAFLQRGLAVKVSRRR